MACFSTAYHIFYHYIGFIKGLYWWHCIEGRALVSWQAWEATAKLRSQSIALHNLSQVLKAFLFSLAVQIS